MTERERLSELIRQVFDSKGTATVEEEADYLLEHGVIVPPCKVGDSLFYIDKYTGKVEKESVRYLTITKNGVCPILTWHNTRFWDMYRWGKDIFLTREDAEAALKAREGNND